MKLCKPDLDDITIDNIKKEYYKDNSPWFLGFSGGKDSSALLKLLYIALKSVQHYHKYVNVLFCDTGVEIPFLHNVVIGTLGELSKEMESSGVPIKIKILYPRLQDRFFSKVIGRGCPPPTNKFRWCTDSLRIRPINRYLISEKENIIMLLGLRRGESEERDRILTRNATGNKYYYKQSGNKNILIYSPIIKYKVKDIWNILRSNLGPKSINYERLQFLYSIVNSDNSTNLYTKSLYTAGRFGCWTCTVVRQDKAVANMISKGHTSLEPLLEYRNWLSKIRDNEIYRNKERRNGTKGLGPFTLEARREILKKLLEVQSKVEWELIGDEEISYIKKQWELDSRHD